MGEKHRVARKAVGDARRAGTLPDPHSLQCVICDAIPATGYHHWHGYGAGFELDVIPVCQKCHYLADKDIRVDATIADVRLVHEQGATLAAAVANGTDGAGKRRPGAYDLTRSAILRKNSEMSLRQIAAQLELATGDIAAMSRISRNESVSTSTIRRIGRALGVVPQPRKLHRPVVSAEEWTEFQEWKARRE